MAKPPKKKMKARRKAGALHLSKTERWLNLLAFLVDRRFPVPREDILSAVDDYRTDWNTGDDTKRESVRRKFERDKSELRQIGIVIQPGPKKIYSAPADQEVDAYQLRPAELYLPYIELSGRRPAGNRPYSSLPALTVKPDEFQVLRRAAEHIRALGDSPLGASAASAVRKLSFDLPEIEPGEKELAFTAPSDAAFHEVFETLRRSVEERRPVSCLYYSIGRDAESRRVIEPYGLMLSWGTWYCVARAREREAVRVFRVSRMRQATVLEDQPPFTVPESFSVRGYLDRAPWELSEEPPARVRVRIAFPHSRWVLAEGLGEVVESADDSGGAVLDFQVRVADPFIRWLLTFGTQAEVLEPADIRHRLAAEVERLRAIYR